MEPTPQVEDLIEVQPDEDTLPFEGPVSPIKAIRDSIPVGLRELAKLLNCSYGMIYLAERGCYSNIPPVLRNWISQVHDSEGNKVLSHGLTIQMIDELYSLYIRETRDLFGETYKFHTLLRDDIDLYRHEPVAVETRVTKDALETIPVGVRVIPPINSLIRYTNLSKTAFYKGLCVQPANIYKLQVAQCKALPGQIIQSLHDSHVPHQVISYLDVLTKDFYAKTKARTNG